MLASTSNQIVCQIAGALRNTFDADFLHDIHTTTGRIDSCDSRRTHLNSRGIGAKFKFTYLKLELIAMTEPACDGWLESGNQAFANVDKRKPRTAHQPLKGAGNQKVDIHSDNIDGYLAGSLVVVDQDMGTVLMSNVSQHAEILDIAAGEEDVRGSK